MRLVAAMALALFLASSAEAQLPEGWQVRADDPDADVGKISFVGMAPGWHVTTGLAAIFFHPDSTASGEYRLESQIFLFDPERRNEAYGILFGGIGLDGQDGRYSYFALRPNGDFIIERRTGAASTAVRDWTASDAIAAWPDPVPDGQSTVENRLAVDVGPRDITFSVNGAVVATLSRAELPTDGITGLRVNGELNLHVTTLAVTKR